MAYNISALNRLGNEVDMSREETNESSISLVPTKSTRNELSEALEKIRLSKETLSETKTSTSTTRSEGSKPPTDSEVKLQQKIISLIQRETERASTNIVMHVKYYSSPLRLVLKTKFMTLPPEQKMQYASVLKMGDFVKNDLISDWTVKDFFGLKILIKMYRLYMAVFPMLSTQKEFLEYFQPMGVGNEPHKDTVYYLYNYVMNPGFGYYSQDNPVSLEHEVHQWLTTFLADRQDLLDEVGFDLVDFQKELIKKTAFELNVLASTLFKKPISFKYFTSPTNITKETMDAVQIMTDLHKMYQSYTPLNIVAEQMMFWLNQDESMEGQPRAILGGMGGKKKKRTTRK